MGASPRGVDWNEDGRIDLISGEYEGTIKLFINTGSGSPGAPPDLTDAGYIQANGVDIDVGRLSVPEVNDWNEDGRKDLIVGCDAGYIYVYLNVGTNAAPVFGGYSQIEADGATIVRSKNCPRIADLNEDGLKDLVLAWIEGSCLYWPNRGTNAAPVFGEEYELATYTEPIDPEPGAYNWSHFDVCDWNEDRHPDLVYTRWESDLKVHLHGTNNIECHVDPVNPPVVIPGGGGSFVYQVSVTNHSAYDIPLDLWTEFVLPNMNPYGPVRQVAGRILPAGATRQFPLMEWVPGYAPPGAYNYNLFLGKLGSCYYLHDGFALTKM